MKALSKYMQLLEKQLELAEERLADARKDLEFYRGKCERLEMAVMSVAAAPAAAEYVSRSDKPPIREARAPQPLGVPRIPFGDLKRKWNAMSAEEQDKAMKEGWDVDQAAIKQEEEANAGK